MGHSRSLSPVLSSPRPRSSCPGTFFTVVYIVERLVLQTIYVLSKEILRFLSLKLAVYNQERFLMARVFRVFTFFSYHSLKLHNQSTYTVIVAVA
jgi:hypothetical protein